MNEYDEELLRIPLVEERASVGARTVVTGRVRVAKRTNEHEETLDVPVRREALEVRRVPVGRWLDAPVEVRQEGDTLIVPVMEEVAVVEKRLRLKEELHILSHRREERTPVRVSLRSEEAQIERIGAAEAAQRPEASAAPSVAGPDGERTGPPDTHRRPDAGSRE